MKYMSTWAVISAICVLSAGCAVTTPKLSEQDIAGRIATDREVMFKDQEPLVAPITLEEAMARSIKYNLDHRLKIMEHALSLRQSDLTTFDMLPRLVAAAGYTERDSYNASSSMNVATGQQSLAPSTSQDKGHFNGDLTLTWNILDFGVSYFQAKQQADRAHILKERRRKVIHSIMQQIRQQYWLALGAQQLEGRFTALLQDVEKALKDTSSVEQEKLRPPIETLTYRKTLLEIIKQLETFRDEMAQAKTQLATLMNLPLGQSFTIVPLASLLMPKGPDAVQYLEIRALLQRPELIEADYNERISVYETRKAIARMLPGIELSVGGHSDSNSFLVDQQWIEGGARLTWNLMNLISGQSQYKIATGQVEIAQAQRLALSVAILTQVHVAYQNFYSRKRQFELSEQLQDVDTRIHEQTMNQAMSGSQNRLNEIRSATSALMAEYRSYQNYASLQNACGQIVATLGDDPLPETIASHEIKALTGEIGARLNAPGALCAPTATGYKPVAAAKAVPADEVVHRAPAAAAAPVQTVQSVEQPAPDISGATSAASTPAVAPAPPPVKASSTAKRPDSMSFALEFDSGQSDITPDHYARLKKLADYLKECPEVTGEITGHTDNVRFPDKSMDNLKLSQLRADNIRLYLIITYGIDPKRISARGYGSTKPVADNNTEEGKRKNRRIGANFRCIEK